MLLLPLLREALVDLSIQLARWIEADVEQCDAAGIIATATTREQRQHADACREDCLAKADHSPAPSLSLLGRYTIIIGYVTPDVNNGPNVLRSCAGSDTPRISIWSCVS